MGGWSIPADGSNAGRAAGAGAREMQVAAKASTPTWLRVARRAYGLHDDERAWRLGAEGEEAVARTLTKLGDGWTVLHDLPLSSSGTNLDHLVIGPGGVFALNTKNLTGKVWVGERMVMHNGRRTSYLPASRSEAKKVAAILAAATGREGPVLPVLVVMCDELTVKQQPPDVAVVGRRRLRRWLNARPAQLDASAVQLLTGAAMRTSTWPSEPTVRDARRH